MKKVKNNYYINVSNDHMKTDLILCKLMIAILQFYPTHSR